MRSSSRVRVTASCSPEKGTNARCGRRPAQSHGMNAPKPRRRSGSGWRSASGRAPADHPHDLQVVALSKRGGLVRGTFEDGPVVLHRDRTRVDAELLQIIQQGSRAVELDMLAVDLQPDHENIPIAAYPAAPAAWHSAIRSSVTPPIARTGIRTERATSSSAARPAGGTPGWLALSHTGPKMMKSAPSRCACCAPAIE